MTLRKSGVAAAYFDRLPKVGIGVRTAQRDGEVVVEFPTHSESMLEGSREDVDARIYWARVNGAQRTDIARTLGISLQRVYKACERHALRRRRLRLEQEEAVLRANTPNFDRIEWRLEKAEQMYKRIDV